jgi:toluene monooxygenase system protein E
METTRTTSAETNDPLLRPLKTWSHLAARRRRPTEYETVSTNLLWSTSDPERPWAMGQAIAMTGWFKKYRNQSPLVHPDWDGFRDPDQLIYRNYTLIQDGQEAFVDGLLTEHDRNDHDLSLPRPWLEALATHWAPGRYLVHALQMSSNYLVALAPASTIVNCFMLQAGDQLRWVSRVAYRTGALRKVHPDLGFGEAERRHWEEHAAWQGFRELAEKTLVAWDWAEQFTALNLVLKPAIDATFLTTFGREGKQQGDTLTGLLADAQLIDSERTRRWSSELVRYAVEGGDGNAGVLRGWIDKWQPLGLQAIDAFCTGLPDAADLRAAARAQYVANQVASTGGAL